MKYSIKHVTNKIVVVVVPDRYDRGMLFCRVQEFYESPSRKFRNNSFSIWDYAAWYVKTYGKTCFSYPMDFTGFNLPLDVVVACYERNEIETPYDVHMFRIAMKLWDGSRKYLIGVNSLDGTDFQHEIAHAMYYTNLTYRCEADAITNQLSKPDFKQFKTNLAGLGYCSRVTKDEIQAYMSTELSPSVTYGIPNKRKLHSMYKEVFQRNKRNSICDA